LAPSPLRLPLAFTLAHRVVPEEIDEYAHVNNAVYLQWLDRIAWTHSAQLGVTLAHCLTLRRGMAVRHTRIDYLEAAVFADDLLLATWLVACDGRLRCTRRFEIVRVSDHKRIAEAEIEYFCLNLDSGKPCRFPPEFVRCYAADQAVVAAYERLPPELRRMGYSRGAQRD
jgi:acyl-CoA thioester hydrolase